MKDEFTREFFEYIDQHLTRQQVADALGNSTKTLSSWKSIGIPDGKLFACRSLIETHRADQIAPTNVIVMRPSYDQFKNWNLAALESGQTIEDWAFDGLEEMASRHFEGAQQFPTYTSDQKVAEQSPDFNSKIKDLVNRTDEEEESEGTAS